MTVIQNEPAKGEDEKGCLRHPIRSGNGEIAFLLDGDEYGTDSILLHRAAYP